MQLSQQFRQQFKASKDRALTRHEQRLPVAVESRQTQRGGVLKEESRIE
jgi:hypothetical protein